jgi:hypothetical protein
MDKKTYSKEEMQNMVAQLESEFTSIMKSEQAAQLLAKSEEEAKEEEKQEPKEEAKEEAKEEPKEESKEEAKEQPQAEAKEDDEAHGYDENDLEELNKMYASMSKGERNAHKSALEKCGEMSMAKSEETQVVVTTEESEESKLLKSEVEGIKKENEELKKELSGVMTVLNTFIAKKAPARKAITDIEVIKKSEETVKEQPLTKSEINERLRKSIRDPKLDSKDREAINNYYLNNAGVDKIKHLLGN